MLRIESRFRYARHYVSSMAIAEEVKADLESRPLPTNPEDEAERGDIAFARNSEVTIEEPYEEMPHAMYDPGGMALMNDEVFSFPLGDIVVECKAQHFDFFVSWISEDTHHNRIRGEETKYRKIHGYWSCICVTPEEFEQLRALVNNPELAMKARDSWNKRESALASAGVVLSVVKEDGEQAYVLAGGAQKPSIN